ncbi:MAG: DUF3427 domain-containing protein [Proteobacteria bacterium]|nr:DUF3427 domain-containing protein [Pseudomonadota bacterium]
MASEHQYEDRFLSSDEFQWVSQNRTTQGSKAGAMIHDHGESGISVHLFVRDQRKTPDGNAASFIYCGDVEFLDWEGDKPVTVRWRMKEQLPDQLAARFGL